MNKPKTRTGVGNLAFTLAEVLITLVIIGIIAAITVPTLTAQYRKKVYVTQLKKAYSMLSNGFKLAMSKDGVTLLEDTDLFQSIEGDDTTAGSQEKFLKKFSQVFTEMKTYTADEVPEDMQIGYKYLKYDGNIYKPMTGTRISYYLNNGSIMYATFKKVNSAGDVTGTNEKKNVGNIFIDVNGAQKPNQIGRDLFYFFLLNNGRVVPYGEKEYNENLHWRVKNWCNTNTAWIPNGLACTGRIVEEGWEMNY